MVSSSRGSFDEREAHRTVIHRLRREVGAARIAPPAGLRARTLARLADAPPDSTAEPPGRRAVFVARLAACIALAGVAAIALWPSVRTEPARPSLQHVRLDRVLDKPIRDIRELPAWEQPLVDEARHLVADAQIAGRLLLGRFTSKSRTEGEGGPEG